MEKLMIAFMGLMGFTVIGCGAGIAFGSGTGLSSMVEMAIGLAFIPMVILLLLSLDGGSSEVGAEIPRSR